MKELILEYLNEVFYCSDNSAYQRGNNSLIGFRQIEGIVIRTFHLNEDLTHLLIFNWLLANGIKSISKDWDKHYITSPTKDIIFNYQLTNE